MRPVQNLLFDLDGTLVDSSKTIRDSVDYALEQTAVPAASGPGIESVIGKPLFDIFCTDYGMTRAQANIAIGHYRRRYEALEQAGTRIYENVPAGLARLTGAGFNLFIATVKPTAIAEKVLLDLGLRRHFDGVAGGSMGSGRRDKSSIIAHAIQKFGLDPGRSVMIGDRDQDICGARDNGMSAVAVTYGFGSGTELDSAQPDHRAGRFDEIVSLFVNPSVAK